jgi:cytochrome b
MKTIRNFLIDFVIFAAFLLAAEPHITGDTIHEWLGLGFFVTAMIHLLLHWGWVANSVKKFFKKMPALTRINSIVDFSIFVAFTVITITGVMMSKSVLPTLGISAPRGGSWKQIHSLASDISIYLVATHFALHWTWITGVVRKYVGAPLMRIFQRQPKMAVVPIKVEKEL